MNKKDHRDFIKNSIQESISCKMRFIEESENIDKAARSLIKCFRNNRKVLICGNGGSAADSQHIAGELVNMYKMHRKALPALSLTTDTSVLTSWSNDCSFDSVFERQVEAHGRRGDVLIGLSTSGNSLNVIRAINRAKKIGMTVLSFTGNDGGCIKPISDININVDSKDTPKIQECHVTALHIVCDVVERELFS